jgi:hypothetical protein
MMNLPPQRPKPLLALLGLVVVMELLRPRCRELGLRLRQFEFAADNADKLQKIWVVACVRALWATDFAVCLARYSGVA